MLLSKGPAVATGVTAGPRVKRKGRKFALFDLDTRHPALPVTSTSFQKPAQFNGKTQQNTAQTQEDAFFFWYASLTLKYCVVSLKTLFQHLVQHISNVSSSGFRDGRLKTKPAVPDDVISSSTQDMNACTFNISPSSPSSPSICGPACGPGAGVLRATA